MNLLISQLEKLYKENHYTVSYNSDKTHLILHQRIVTEGGFLRLQIHIMPNEEDIQTYQFACYGLGQIDTPTESDKIRIARFNENQREMVLALDENNQLVLTHKKTFHNIVPYDIGLGTLGEAMKCITVFQPFIKNNYSELKRIIKK